MWIQHDGFFSRSLHLASFSVRVGTTVKAGDPIGIMGRTGAVDIHLHLEITPGKVRYANTGQVDPVTFITERIAAAAGSATPESARPTPVKASLKMTIYARRDDGLVVAIPEGGPTYNYPSAEEYNRHRETIAVINGQRQADGQPLVTLPPVLGSIVTMTSERLNDLIRSQGAVLSAAPVVNVQIPDVNLPELDVDEIAKRVNDEADKRARDRLDG